MQATTAVQATRAAAPGPCQVCGGRAHAPLIEHAGMTFWRCGGCGFVYLHPMPDDAAFAALYANPDSGGTRAYFGKLESKLRRARRRVALIARRLPGGPRGRRFLDIGCSGGFTAKAAAELGFAAFGIDPDADAVAWARAHYPEITVAVGRAEDWVPPDGRPFDAVYCSEVIEHVPDVNHFAAALARLTARGGLLYLTTPDIGHWRRPRDLARWDVFTPPHHCVFFSEANLRRLLARHGFAVRHRRPAFKPGLKVLAERLGPAGASSEERG